MDFSTGGSLIGGFINPGGPPFLKLHFVWQRGLINTAGFINPNLTLLGISSSQLTNSNVIINNDNYY